MHRGAYGKLIEAARALYEKEPTDRELAAFGLKRTDVDREVSVWPENWQAFNLFASLQTQWRTGGMGGATGLDYNVLFHKMDRMRLSVDEYERLEEDIRVMELEALRAMNEKD